MQTETPTIDQPAPHGRLSVVPEALSVEDVRSWLRTHLAEPEMTQAKVAKSIGMSATAISLFLAEKYAGQNDALAAALESYLRKAAERRLTPRKPVWQQTSVATGVFAVLEKTAIRRQIATIVGAPGMGKTMTIRSYAERHKEAIVITAHEGVRGAKGLVNHLLVASRLHSSGGRTLDSQLADIVDGLRDSGRLVIVDECQALQPRSLECLRYIHDEAGVGLVLCGNLSTHPMLTRQGAGLFAQLFSRISYIHRIPNELPLEDVALITRSACPGLGDEHVAFLAAILGQPLCDVRTMVDTLFDAMELARGEGSREVTGQHLRDAAVMHNRAAQLRPHLPSRRTR